MEISKKEILIKRERARIKRALKDLDKNKYSVVAPLIDSAASTWAMLAELDETIHANGYTVEYQNGENQHGTRQSDEIKTFIALQKNYMAIIRTLADVAPPCTQKNSKLKMLMEQ